MRILRQRFTTLFEAEAFLEKNHDLVEIRPAGPHFHVTTTLLLLGDLRIWASKIGSEFEILGGSRPSRYWICLPVHGSTEVRFGGRTESLSGGHGWIRDSETLASIRRHPGYSEVAFDIPHEVLHDQMARVRGQMSSPAVRVERMLDVSRGNGRLMSKLVSGVIAGVDDGTTLAFSPFAAQNLSNLVLDLLVHGTILDSTAGTRGEDSRSIRRAMDFIEENLQRPLTLIDIAEAARVCPRALQKGFLRQFGCSPLKYIRQLRLARVRHELMIDPDHQSIAAIAARWGFFHLGLFARQYRDSYGELPSHTRRLCASRPTEKQ